MAGVYAFAASPVFGVCAHVPALCATRLTPDNLLLRSATSFFCLYAAIYKGRDADFATRGKRLTTASLVSAGTAVLGLGAMLWGLRQPRRLRRKLNNNVAKLVAYQLRQPENSAVGDVTRMASPSNMVRIWRSRQRNPRAAYGGIAEGAGFWATILGVAGALTGGITKMKTVSVDRDINEKEKLYLNKRLGAAAERAFDLLRKGLPAAWRLIFVVSGPS